MKTALIFAAGLGTRLKPLTDTTPKALVKIGGKTLLQIAIEKIQLAGFERIVINAHHFAEQIFDFVQKNDFDAEIIVSHEKEMLLDTGGGILFAQKYLESNEPFLVHNVDIISNVDLKKFYNAHKPENLATLLVSSRNTSRYLLFDSENCLAGWQNINTGEIKTPFQNIEIEKYNRLAFNGIHVISSRIFELMKNEKMPFSITDFYISICNKEKIIGCQQPDLEVIDVGTVEKIDNVFSTQMTQIRRIYADFY
ncbi:MAG: NTP transferase domain-containing protein [Prevotellaceae bacterium]|jgi:NDP-sugar pyrophosphorylase family protein|nr:NTP transferase domain-containing protein [Prevotellaceae bacterium]